MNIEITNNELPRKLRHEIGDLLKESLIGIESIQKGKNFAIWSKNVSRAIHTLVGLASFNNLDDLSGHLQHFMEIFDTFKSFEPNEEQIIYLLEVIEEIQHITNDESVDFTEMNFSDFVSLNPDMVGEVEEPKKPTNKTPSKNDSQPTSPIMIKDEEVKGIILFYFRNEKVRDKILSPLSGNYEVESILNDGNWTVNASEREADLILVEISDDLKEEIIHLKEFNTKFRSLPIIFVKNDFSKLDILELINFGGANFIQKPFSPPIISSVIEETYFRSKASQLLEKKLDFFLYQFKEIEQVLEEKGMGEQVKDLKYYLDSYRKEKELYENRRNQVKEFNKVK